LGPEKGLTETKKASSNNLFSDRKPIHKQKPSAAESPLQNYAPAQRFLRPLGIFPLAYLAWRALVSQFSWLNAGILPATRADANMSFCF
jgi:hypothetical protein